MSDNATTYTPVVEELTNLILLENQNSAALEARALNGSLLQKVWELTLMLSRAHITIPRLQLIITEVEA